MIFIFLLAMKMCNIIDGFHLGLASLAGFSQLQAYITIIHILRNALTWKTNLMLIAFVVGIGRYMLSLVYNPPISGLFRSF
jgi:hypothetical protein